MRKVTAPVPEDIFPPTTTTTPPQVFSGTWELSKFEVHWSFAFSEESIRAAQGVSVPDSVATKAYWKLSFETEEIDGDLNIDLRGNHRYLRANGTVDAWGKDEIDLSMTAVEFEEWLDAVDRLKGEYFRRKVTR